MSDRTQTPAAFEDYFSKIGKNQTIPLFDYHDVTKNILVTL